jgi:hypothetical protein
MRFEEFAHLFASVVTTDEPERRHLDSQATKILNNVSRPTQHRFTPDHIQNGDRSFWRYALNMSPEVLVEHQIAHDRYLATTKWLQAAQ